MDVIEPYGWCAKHNKVVCYNDRCDDFKPAFKRVCGNCEDFWADGNLCTAGKHWSEVYPDDEACEKFRPARELCTCINCAYSEWPCRSHPPAGSVIDDEAASHLTQMCYLVIYDLPSPDVPHYRVRDILRAKRNRERSWRRLQRSVIMCDSLDDAAILAEELWLLCSERDAVDKARILVFKAEFVPLVELWKRAMELRERGPSPAPASHKCVPLRAALNPRRAWELMDEQATQMCASQTPGPASQEHASNMPSVQLHVQGERGQSGQKRMCMR